MAETGHILSVESDSIVIRFARTDACGKCGACSVGANKSDALLTLSGTYDARPGDLAEVELSESKVIGASLLAYGVPLLGLLLGLFIGPAVQNWLSLPGGGDLFAGIGALSFTAIAWLAMRLVNPSLAKRAVFEPRIVRIIPSPNTGDANSEQ